MPRRPGEVFTEFSREAIESVYARAIGDARNQYTLGYATRSTPSSAYREIEVKVAKPDCADYSAPCVRVYARGGTILYRPDAKLPREKWHRDTPHNGGNLRVTLFL